MKELILVIIKDHAYLELYNPKSAPGEEDKPHFSMQKIFGNKKFQKKNYPKILNQHGEICGEICTFCSEKLSFSLSYYLVQTLPLLVL